MYFKNFPPTELHDDTTLKLFLLSTSKPYLLSNLRYLVIILVLVLVNANVRAIFT